MRAKTVKRLKAKGRELGFDVSVPYIWRRLKKAYNKVWRPNREKFLRLNNEPSTVG